MNRRKFIQTSLAATVAGTVLAQAASAKAATKASPWKVGCFTRPWAEHEYTVALDAIAEAGFQYAGFMNTTKTGKRTQMLTWDMPLEEAANMAEAAKSRGLTVAAAWGGRFPTEKGLDTAIAGLTKLIDVSAAATVPDILLGGEGRAEFLETYESAIKACLDYAQKKGVRVCMKPHDTFNFTGADCKATIKRINHPNFSFYYDPGNILHYSKGKRAPEMDSVGIGDAVHGMCVKDYKEGKSVNITPGTGQVDFKKVVKNLRDAGFKGGPMIIECLNPGSLGEILAEAKKTKAMVEGLIAAG
jgi:sugar phosphate isomerase/epimerase